MENFNPEHLPDLSTAGESDREFTFFVYDMATQHYLVTLLDTASISGKQRELLEMEIEDAPNMTEDKHKEILNTLIPAQIDRISNGFNYGATQHTFLYHQRKGKLE